MEVYSHSGVAFNTLVYCLIRSYYIPEIEGLEPKDTWFAVPAIQMGPIINLAHARLENAALMMIDSNGRVVKAHKVSGAPPVLEGYELETVKTEAFSIPMWEQINQAEFPYGLMFNKDSINARHTRAGVEQNMAQHLASTNITYNQVYNRIRATGGCKTCGGNK